ncbi:hypothetical protein Acy02nite_09120 [Actinoplanes cyaneus]|uniref:Uncharacterized protein n=1 Tax=Actinoplanes cyaneus TaxID=52696 RepID=A0A919ID36_9ACTN|nr:hypothetical protein [Actinoplanes cyaneus]MCW2144454.1 hypothetical protein [Actinoplanes cyaneus]GID63031.1 hypothetical protein Acy02nite_09120 [Actinoplanes cyaneus]
MDSRPLAEDAGTADTARLARDCVFADQARRLALWVGITGRPVTAGQVLRRSDVTAAGTLLGVPVPAKVRTAADVLVLRRPWSFALGSGMLTIDGTTATAEPLAEQWSSLGDAEVLDAWRAGFRAVCTADSDPQHQRAVSVFMTAFLKALVTRDDSEQDYFWHRVIAAVEESQEDVDWADRVPLHTLTEYQDRDSPDRFARFVELARHLGVVTGEDSATATVTSLGHWWLAASRAGQPRMISADMPAGTVAEMLADCVRQGKDPWTAAQRWLQPRPPADAARELLPPQTSRRRPGSPPAT